MQTNFGRDARARQVADGAVAVPPDRASRVVLKKALPWEDSPEGPGGPPATRGEHFKRGKPL